MVESLDHVFCEGDVAAAAWNFFGSLAGALYVGASVRGHMARWWFSSRTNAFLQFAHQIISSLICWNIWKARNKARFDDKVYSPSAICGLILDDVWYLFSLKLP